jgi:hypothetical protein
VVYVTDTLPCARGMNVYAIVTQGLVLDDDSTTEPPDGENWFAVYGDIPPAAIRLIAPVNLDKH